MAVRLSTPTVQVNNETVAIVPNSLTFTEGFGEQTVVTQSSGGANVTTVYSDNAEMKKSTVRFSLYSTEANIALARSWKTNGNANTISFAGSASFTRSGTNMAMVNDYEIGLSADGQFDVELQGDPLA